MRCIGNPSAKAAFDIALYALLGGKKEIHTDITVSVDEPFIMVKICSFRLRMY